MINIRNLTRSERIIETLVTQRMNKRMGETVEILQNDTE